MTSIRSILTVDDDESDLFICAYTIRKFDPAITVHTAQHGLAAIELLRRIERPDAIILDINMPVMNGFEFLERYARDFEGHAPVVAMLTSSHLSADRERAMRYDFVTSYFEKPLTRADLQALNDVLGGRA